MGHCRRLEALAAAWRRVEGTRLGGGGVESCAGVTTFGHLPRDLMMNPVSAGVQGRQIRRCVPQYALRFEDVECANK